MDDKLQKPFYAALGVITLGLLGWGAASAGAQGIAFGLFTALTLGGSLICVWERSVVRSAFSLMGTFTGVAGLFLLLGADFLAVAQILIYVGGILALILFGVMLSPPDLAERKLSRVLGGLALMLGAVAWVGSKVAGTVAWATTDELPEPTTKVDEIGVAFLDPEGYVVPFELAAMILTVALVAAVYIARRKASDLTDPRAEERA
ncbi:MAG: NADH-quinone oxidoreductase subunit J [Planctomycetes bacterium]|nr:NADH-quinone oxidoreductase subunit J [Planctomycetota bacterium]